MDLLDSLRQRDKNVALQIASIASVRTHDSRGNVTSEVWCKRTFPADHDMGVLLDAADIRKLLLSQMKQHINKKQDLILELEDSAPVVEWIVGFTKTWEQSWQKHIEKTYDISPLIYSAMQESYLIIMPLLAETFGSDMVRDWKTSFQRDVNWPLTFYIDKARVRAIFRMPELNRSLCMLAARVLHKKINNRAGNYSTKIQRCDIQQQYDNAVAEIIQDIQVDLHSEYRSLLQKRTWTDLIRDHTQNVMPSHRSGDNRIQELDFQTALDISSTAALPTHDVLGNVLSSVWTRNIININQESSVLLETNDLRKVLLEQIDIHLQKRQDLILELEDTTPVIDWIISFATTWQKEYSTKRSTAYDISQTVYSVMWEAYGMIEPYIADTSNATVLEAWKVNVQAAHAAALPATKTFEGEKALVRAFFRSETTSNLLNNLAGKLLLKREVCNRPYTYASKAQRNEITQQLTDSIALFLDDLENEPSAIIDMMTEPNWGDRVKDLT